LTLLLLNVDMQLFEKEKVEGELEEALKLPNSFSLADEVNDYTLTESPLAGVADEI